MSECPYCSRKPGGKDMHPIETHPLDRNCMHFYENLYSPPMTLVMREMAVPHALPMVFGDLSYEAPVGGERQEGPLPRPRHGRRLRVLRRRSDRIG